MQHRLLLLLCALVALPASAQQAFTEVDGLLSVEGESFAARFPSTWPNYTQIHTWKFVPELGGALNSGSSGNGWMESLPDEQPEHGSGPGVPEGPEGARLDYNIWINEPGLYYIWVRGKAKGSESNGLHVGVDGVLSGGQAISGFFPQNQWTWESLRRNFSRSFIEVTTPGLHTLNVWNRDDGFKLDKIVLAKDIGFTPSGTGPEESLTNLGSLVITPGEIPDATELEPFSLTFNAAQGVGPYSWSVEGALPEGLTLDGPTGTLSGIPTERGQYAFLVRVSDSRGERGGRAFVMDVLAAPLQILSQSPAPPATLGVPYSFQVEVTGGEKPYTYFQLRAYPPGLSIDTATGVVSGVPLEAGLFTFAVLVNDAKSAFLNRTFELMVVGDPITISTPPLLPAATVGEDYAEQLVAAGGAGAYQWTAIDPLPAGFSLSPEGMLTGMPTESLGDVSFTLAVTDGIGTRAERQFTLSILAPLVSVTAAGFHEGPVAPDSIVSGFGLGLASEIAQASSRPLPTRLLERRVHVIDAAGDRRDARLFFISPEQVNYLLPPFIAPGPARVEVIADDGSLVASGPLEIQRVAPQLFVSTPGGIVAGYAIRVNTAGEQTVEDLVRVQPDGSLVSQPLPPLEEGEQRYLVVFGTGLRAWITQPTATLAGTPIDVIIAQAHGEFDGLDQVNLGPLPTLSDGATQPQLILHFTEGPTEPVIVPMAP